MDIAQGGMWRLGAQAAHAEGLGQPQEVGVVQRRTVAAAPVPVGIPRAAS